MTKCQAWDSYVQKNVLLNNYILLHNFKLDRKSFFGFASYGRLLVIGIGAFILRSFTFHPHEMNIYSLLGGARKRGGSTNRGRGFARKGARSRAGTVPDGRSRGSTAAQDGDLYGDVGEQHLVSIEIVSQKAPTLIFQLIRPYKVPSIFI